MSRLSSIILSACVFAVSGCVAHQGGPSAAILGDPQSASSRSMAGLTADVPTGFPARCEPSEVQVMLLGTYHFANPGLDEVKQRIDDVLAPTRQREIAVLVERLAAWHPEQVAVEWSASDSASLAARYARYRSGSLAPSRNEIDQIGFRLAARLGLPSVEPIDTAMRLGNDSVRALLARRADLKALADRASARAQQESDSGAASFAAKNIVAQLHELNGDAALHAGNSRGMFSAMLPLGEGTNYGGPQMLARWYERNIVMVHLLYRSLRPSTRRVLVIVGAGHVPPLRNLLDEAPQFCPVSPLPLLRPQ